MLNLKELVRHLERDDVDELVLVTGFRARLKVGKEHETVDDYRLSSDSIVQLLFAAGGSRHIEGLGPRPKQWTTRVEPVGQIVVTATRRAGDIEATFALKSKAKTIDKPAQRSDPRSEGNEKKRDRDRPAGVRRDARADSIPARRKSRRDVAAIREVREVRSGGRDSRRESGAPVGRKRSRSERAPAHRRPADEHRREEPSDIRREKPSDIRREKPGEEPSYPRRDNDLLKAETPAEPKPIRDDSEPEFELADDPQPQRAQVEPEESEPDESEEVGPEKPSEADGSDEGAGDDEAPKSQPPVARARAKSSSFDLKVTADLVDAKKVTLPGEEPSRKKISKKHVYSSKRSRHALAIAKQREAIAEEPLEAKPEKEGRSPSPEPRQPTPEPRKSNAEPGRPGFQSPSPRRAAATEPAAQVRRSREARKPSPHRKQLDRMLIDARDAGASDLHLTAGRPPVLRIATETVPVGDPMPASEVESMALDRVPDQMLDAFEEEGSCGFAVELAEGGRFRFNVTRQRTGIKATIRLIAREIPTLESLGLPPEIERATKHHQGLVVISGPTGHGKTSTLAALVNLLNDAKSLHIITVEDPIEYVHPRKKALISQREIGTTTRSFHRALKGSLRQDPDVIVVGELRDTETVRMAIAASETGHLVLGTMNTPSAAKTIDRLIDLFPPGDQPQIRATLAGGLRMIVSQRLVPDHDRNRVHAAAEVLPGSMALWTLIRDNKTFQIPSLQQRGRGAGVIRLNDSLAELVRDGKCSLEDAQRVSENPDELAQAHGRPVTTTSESDGKDAVVDKSSRRGGKFGEIVDDPDAEDKGPRAWLKKVFGKGS